MHFVLPMCHIVERVELCIVCGTVHKTEPISIRTRVRFQTRAFGLTEYVTDMYSSSRSGTFWELNLGETFQIYL